VSLAGRSWIAQGFGVGLICLAAAASGQTVGESQGRQMTFLPVNARAAALGDASGALLSGIEGVSSNPAVLAWLTGPRVEYTFQRLSSDASLEHVAAGVRTGGSSALGLHLDMLHYGGFDFYSRSDIRERGFELNGGASYSAMLTEDLAAGLSVYALTSTTDADPVWAVSADAGLTYMPGRYHKFGLALREFGTDYDVAQPVIPPDVPDPRPSRAVSLAAVFDYPLDTGSQRLVLAFENDKMIGRHGLLYKVGIEYQPLTILALRGGIQVRENEVEPRGGVGVVIGPVHIDYAYGYHAGTVPAHVVTVGYAGD
jgi:hypothetical protein